jgi:hypothetical protein
MMGSPKWSKMNKKVRTKTRLKRAKNGTSNPGNIDILANRHPKNVKKGVQN